MTGNRPRLLTISVVVVATSGMVYELALATLGSYFLGNAVLQFSLTLGIYLAAMGVGTVLSRGLHAADGDVLAARFVEVETAVALVGGTSAAVLFWAFTRTALFRPLLYVEVFAVGALVGIELPLLLRLLREDLGRDESVAQGMTYDYVGGLAASLLFPLLLIPFLGLVRTAAVAGIINAAVAWFGSRLVARRSWRLGGAPIAVALALSVLIGFADTLVRATAD